jgi:hypothetical protein
MVVVGSTIQAEPTFVAVIEQFSVHFARGFKLLIYSNYNEPSFVCKQIPSAFTESLFLKEFSSQSCQKRRSTHTRSRLAFYNSLSKSGRVIICAYRVFQMLHQNTFLLFSDTLVPLVVLH